MYLHTNVSVARLATVTVGTKAMKCNCQWLTLTIGGVKSLYAPIHIYSVGNAGLFVVHCFHWFRSWCELTKKSIWMFWFSRLSFHSIAKISNQYGCAISFFTEFEMKRRMSSEHWTHFVIRNSLNRIWWLSA